LEGYPGSPGKSSLTNLIIASESDSFVINPSKPDVDSICDPSISIALLDQFKIDTVAIDFMPSGPGDTAWAVFRGVRGVGRQSLSGSVSNWAVVPSSLSRPSELQDRRGTDLV